MKKQDAEIIVHNLIQIEDIISREVNSNYGNSEYNLRASVKTLLITHLLEGNCQRATPKELIDIILKVQEEQEIPNCEDCSFQRFSINHGGPE